ncbi:MAG: hypothetical protein JST68_12030 [Bacteroidetes bacterium]|nr:hypothetical protein [Bacteroidota bacterium]
MQKNQPNIYTILNHLKVRKAMYLGNDFTFQSLDSFISGFAMAASSSQLQAEGYPDFSYFNTWLLGHLKNHSGLGGGWYWQISNRHPNDETEAFDEFFDFLDVFKGSLTHKKCVIIDNDMAVNPKPSKVIMTKIDHSTTVWLEYVDDNGNEIFTDEWFINQEEAMNSLKSKSFI